MALAIVAVLNTEDGTRTLEGLGEGVAIGSDLSADVGAGGTAGAPRGAGLVYTNSYFSIAT